MRARRGRGQGTSDTYPPATQGYACLEHGGTLPATLWALAVGAVVMAPFLGQLSTSLLAGRDSQKELREQYSSDSSIEFAIWKLQNDQTYRDSVDVAPGTPITVAPAVTVNGITTTTSSTAIPIGTWTAMSAARDWIAATRAVGSRTISNTTRLMRGRPPQ